MPRHEVIYDKTLKETPEWKFLYNKWRWLLKQPHSKDFESFPIFYEWSMANGYEIGAKLERQDTGKPYSIQNCMWVHREATQRAYTEEEIEWIELWNRTVNKIRRHYGMKLLPETEVCNG